MVGLFAYMTAKLPGLIYLAYLAYLDFHSNGETVTACLPKMAPSNENVSRIKVVHYVNLF